MQRESGARQASRGRCRQDQIGGTSTGSAGQASPSQVGRGGNDTVRRHWESEKGADPEPIASVRATAKVAARVAWPQSGTSQLGREQRQGPTTGDQGLGQVLARARDLRAAMEAEGRFSDCLKRKATGLHPRC